MSLLAYIFPLLSSTKIKLQYQTHTSIFKGLLSLVSFKALKTVQVLLPIMNIWHVMRQKRGGGDSDVLRILFVWV